MRCSASGPRLRGEEMTKDLERPGFCWPNTALHPTCGLEMSGFADMLPGGYAASSCVWQLGRSFRFATRG